MNFVKYYLFAALLLFPSLLRSQISNVQVSAKGDQIIITYDYVAQDESIDDIIVTYTTGDETEVKEARQLSGDVQNITPGKDKQIIWSPLSEMTSFLAENLVIHLTGVRDQIKQAECDNNLKLADKFFSDKNYKNALAYYNEIFDCTTCNCNPKDIARATNQIHKLQLLIKAKDRYNISYFFDMATAAGGRNMHGLSAFLLRNNGIGYYASFRSDKNFYLPQGYISYFEDNENSKENFELNYLDNSRISSWLFSTGLTFKLINSEYVSAFLYGGAGLGANGTAGEYNIIERGYTGKQWITDGVKNLFFSPEAGIIATIADYFSVLAGIKYPLSITKNEAMKIKGPGVMLGIGINLKSPEEDDYKKLSSYISYTIDLPAMSSSNYNQNINSIGFSAGTISYNKLGAYVSARINPLLFNSKVETDLIDNSIYTGECDYANAFGTVGLTWMYFYGGIGASYQKEYKAYNSDGAKIWNSQKSMFGLCTEFGVNLRLFDRLLLRGGVTFPGFKINSQNNVVKMGSKMIYYSLGIGYVLPSSK